MVSHARIVFESILWIGRECEKKMCRLEMRQRHAEPDEEWDRKCVRITRAHQQTIAETKQYYYHIYFE